MTASASGMDVLAARVAIIEDNVHSQFALTKLLEVKLGVRACYTCASGREFFALLEADPQLKLDLILLDLHIPDEDGFTILQQIRATPRLDGTRVVAVTANLVAPAIARARTAGFDGFIGKPIRPRDFPQQIRQILAGQTVWSID